MQRYRVMELAAAYTPEIIEFWGRVFRDEKAPLTARLHASDRLMERAYGKPAQAVEVAQASKIIYEVRWLPPDPNDRSRLIEETNE
jgi:hypothetical protein